MVHAPDRVVNVNALHSSPLVDANYTVDFLQELKPLKEKIDLKKYTSFTASIERKCANSEDLKLKKSGKGCGKLRG